MGESYAGICLWSWVEKNRLNIHTFNFPHSKLFLSLRSHEWRGSSGGQSVGFITRRSGVQVSPTLHKVKPNKRLLGFFIETNGSRLPNGISEKNTTRSVEGFGLCMASPKRLSERCELILYITVDWWICLFVDDSCWIFQLKRTALRILVYVWPPQQDSADAES